MHRLLLILVELKALITNRTVVDLFGHTYVVSKLGIRQIR